MSSDSATADLLFDKETWAELREGFGLSLSLVPARWLPDRELYQAELRWQLYRELPLWAADPELGERTNRCIFFLYSDDGEVDGVCFVPQFPK